LTKCLAPTQTVPVCYLSPWRQDRINTYASALPPAGPSLPASTVRIASNLAPVGTQERLVPVEGKPVGQESHIREPKPRRRSHQRLLLSRVRCLGGAAISSGNVSYRSELLSCTPPGSGAHTSLGTIYVSSSGQRDPCTGEHGQHPLMSTAWGVDWNPYLDPPGTDCEPLAPPV
jgi:hypothetical protein